MLPWQGGDYKYKYDFKLKDIMEMKKNIRVIYDRSNSDIEEIKKIIINAKRFFSWALVMLRKIWKS